MFRTFKYKFNYIHACFLLSILVWEYCFRGFLLKDLPLSSDALAYLEHFKFYLTYIGEGIYPLWENKRNMGFPAEFFLRRIGSFNPCIFMPLYLNKMGVSFDSAYLFFLSFYYFLGLAAFYKISKRLFNSRNIAFICYLTLMFSSLGTRLFDSYFLLASIPMAWFFYFLIAFFQNQKKYQFIGICFSVMVLVTTYIPFYFLNIILTFLFLYSIFYCHRLLGHVRQLISFFKLNRILSVLCLLAVLLSLIPGVNMYVDARKGELSMPMRSWNAEDDHSFKVDIETVKKWGIEEDLSYAFVNAGLKNSKFAVLYIPFLAINILILGLFTRITKRLFFLFTWCMLIFIMFGHRGPVYEFLFQHVFYFKYFRNLHFFLWMILLPLFVLAIGEKLRMILEMLNSSTLKKITAVTLFIVLEILICVIIYMQNKLTMIEVVSILSVVVLLVLVSFNKINSEGKWFVALFSLALVLHPIINYHYFSKNIEKNPDYLLHTKKIHKELNFPSRKTLVLKDNSNLASRIQLDSQGITPKDPRMYAGIKWVHTFLSFIPETAINSYLISPFQVYDQVLWVDHVDYQELANSFYLRENKAYAVGQGRSGLESNGDQKRDNHFRFYAIEDNDIELIHYSPNKVQIQISLPEKKYLVFNDAYHSDWRAEIDGISAEVYRSNLAFKGLWIPPGTHLVTFKFGQPLKNVLNVILLILFHAVFLSIGYYYYHEKIKNNNDS